MKKKKLIIAAIMIIMVICLIIFGTSTERVENVENITSNYNETEIEPEEEISELANYESRITLYFEDRKSGILTKEIRTVNAKNLLDNPYYFTINELLKGPQNSELISALPEGTKVNKTVIDNRTLIVDVSKEFLNSNGTNAIYSIVNTMTEYNEIENVKITVDGKEESSFKEKFVRIQ